MLRLDSYYYRCYYINITFINDIHKRKGDDCLMSAKGHVIDVGKVERAALNAGISERELLRKAGCAHDILAKARQGKTATNKTIWKIAQAVGCQPVELIRCKGGGACAED